jgi:RNA polymerase sigma factor (sigma-70 family)
MDRPDGWIYVTAMRLALRDKRDGGLPSERPIGDVSEQVADRESVRELLEHLPDRQRAAVTLRYLADLSLRDVADAMGCAVGTVKSTIHAALSQLRVELDDPCTGQEEGAVNEHRRPTTRTRLGR